MMLLGPVVKLGTKLVQLLPVAKRCLILLIEVSEVIPTV